jgi:hypothetical protein
MKNISNNDNIIKGSISEMIDNVLDEEDYVNQEQKFRKTSDWKNTSYKINESEDSKNQEIFQTGIQIKNKNNSQNKNNENNTEDSKILNEDLFKGKGFRTNKESFLKEQEDLLNKSGISDISVLTTLPNVYTCAIPRPGTSRFKGAVKSSNINIDVKKSYSKKILKKI